MMSEFTVHTARHGVALLNQNLPYWSTHRDELNASPLAHEEW